MSFFGNRHTSLVLAVLFLAIPFIAARAATIGFVATDLTDVTPGEDLWRYDYLVSGRSFLSSEFFDIYFDPSRYGALKAEPALNSGWDVAVLQQPNPDNFPPFDVGIFDAFALVGSPSLTDAFSVTFVYLGPGSPGSQRFAIFDAKSNLVESGFTGIPRDDTVPEPSTAALILIGLIAGAFHIHRRTAIPR